MSLQGRRNKFFRRAKGGDWLVGLPHDVQNGTMLAMPATKSSALSEGVAAAWGDDIRPSGKHIALLTVYLE